MAIHCSRVTAPHRHCDNDVNRPDQQRVIQTKQEKRKRMMRSKGEALCFTCGVAIATILLVNPQRKRQQQQRTRQRSIMTSLVPQHFQVSAGISLDQDVNLEQTTRRMATDKLSRVETVTVWVDPSFALHSKLGLMFDLMRSIGRLTRLRTVHILSGGRKDQVVSFPVSGLAALLGESTLERLQVKGVELTYSGDDLLQLSNTVQNQPPFKLREINISLCSTRATTTSMSSSISNASADEKPIRQQQQQKTQHDMQQFSRTSTVSSHQPLDALFSAFSLLPHLETLQVSASVLGSLGDLSSAAVRAAATSSSLHTLRLSHVPLHAEHVHAFQHFASGSNLTTLHLDGLVRDAFRNSEQAVAHLVRADFLNELEVHWTADTTTNIAAMASPQASTEIAQALAYNCTLQIFRWMGDYGDDDKNLRQALVQVLKCSNFSLTTLELNEPIKKTRMTKHWRRQCNFYLRLNARTDWRRHLLGSAQNEGSKEDWVEALVEERDSASALFYYLSNNPALLCG